MFDLTHGLIFAIGSMTLIISILGILLLMLDSISDILPTNIGIITITFSIYLY